MPVTAYPGPDVSNGDGVATVFAYSFRILDEEDLLVTVDGVEKTWPTDFTVAGVGDAGGGSITFTTAPANGAQVVRARERAYSREIDYQRNGGFDEETVDKDFDSLQMQIQQIAAAITRAFKPPIEVTSDQALTTAQWAARASKVMGFNASGVLDLFAAADVPLTAVSAFISTLLDDADAAAAQATLLLGTKSTVASATTPDIWTGTGTLIDFTGNTTVTGFAAAPRAGIMRALLCASTPQFNHAGATMVIPGAANYVATAGDLVLVYAETTTKFRLFIIKNNGQAVVSSAPSAASDTAQGIVELATTAETQTGTDATRAVTPAGLRGAMAVSKSFTSSAQTITAGGLLTLAHGLAAEPKWVGGRLQCTSADNGYSSGDKVDIHTCRDLANSRNPAIYFDTTNIYVRFGSGVGAFGIPTKGTGTYSAAIDATKWQLYIEALG